MVCEAPGDDKLNQFIFYWNKCPWILCRQFSQAQLSAVVFTGNVSGRSADYLRLCFSGDHKLNLAAERWTSKTPKKMKTELSAWLKSINKKGKEKNPPHLYYG